MLSIVIAARNDNYGGDFLYRLQVFINVLLPQMKKYNLDAELIIAEWNPPHDRVQLKDALIWPKNFVPNTVRIITVPEEFHMRLPNAERMPMFEFIAKNVGIRRAKGHFVLVTNPDILFSEELVIFLASQKLSNSQFYRIDRYDFYRPVPLHYDYRAALSFAKKHVYRIHIRQRGLQGPNSIGMRRFQRWYYLLSGKWPGSYQEYSHMRPKSKPLISFNDDNGAYNGIYTNASGDFLLASSKCWRQIKGFPEYTNTFTHLDSYACYQLKALGLEQALFLPPCMIFHAEHHRNKTQTRPQLTLETWMQDLQKIQEGELGPAINDSTWGFGNEELPETNIEEATGRYT